jgi:acetyltransferase-like isoleucine patch superfamily enzyme
VSEAPHVRGRDRFRAVRPILHGGAQLLGHAPPSVARALLSLLRNVPGEAGLGLRYMCVRRLAETCGDNVAIYPGAFLMDVDRIRFGSNVKIGEMCFIGASGGVVIEDDVSLAHATTVLTEEHDYRQPGALRDTPLLLTPVHIESGAWIGAGVRITAGVRIGRGAAVGAGSVVTKDVAPGSVVAGVPARPIAERPDGSW